MEVTIDFSKIKTVHFIGVGGIGTSAIARAFLLEGKKVSGTDMAESEVTKALREAGAAISIGENAKNVPADCDVVVYTIAVLKQGAPLSDKGAPCLAHAELVEAKKRGIPILSYPEALGIISKDKYSIVITGTHGKTTTTAMIAKIMMDAGLDPTVILGSFLLDVEKGSPRSDLKSGERSDLKGTPRTNFVAGKSKYLVVEGCEYCRSFMNLHPNILVITNIDADHLDYYRDMQDIVSAFVELSQKLPRDGYLVIDSHAPNVQAVVKQSHAQNGDFAALKLPEGFRLHIPGTHNLLNAKAAWGVAKILGIPDAQALRSLQEFRGTWRRFEYRGQVKNGALVYDDYGHHPTEIHATLTGTRELFPKEKIIVVFQPHLYSRTKRHLAGFGSAFKEASSVILLPIYPARERDPGDINSQMVVDELRKNAKDAHCVETFAEAAALAEKLSGAGDLPASRGQAGLILTLGAGETNKVADILTGAD